MRDPSSGQPIRDAAGNPVPYEGEKGSLSAGCHITLGGLGYVKHRDGVPKSMGGTGRPIPEDVILNQREISDLKKLVAEYNETIARAAKKYGAVLVDFHRLFAETRSKGLPVRGRIFALEYPSGGLISSDGIHPTSLGYAVIANEFIRRINWAFGYKIPYVPYNGLIEK
jgi:hypothetical protein